MSATAARSDQSFAPALQLMGGRLLGFVATFFVPIVLARIFEPTAFGTYKQLFLIYAVLFGIGQVGMAESLFYFLPLDPPRTRRYLANALAALTLSGSAIAVVLWLGAGTVAGWLGNPALEPLLPLLGLYLLLMLVGAGLEITLICWNRHRAASLAYAASDVVRAGLLVGPAVVTGDLWWLLVGAASFAAVRVVAELGVFGLGSRAAGREPLRPDRSLLRSQLRYVLPFQASVVVVIAHTHLHQLAVAHWFEPAIFAVYAVGCLQLPLVDFAASSAGNVLMVRTGRALADDDRAAARRTWLATTGQLALLLFPLFVVLEVVADDLIPFLYTADYRDSVPIFMVWTLAILPSVLQTDCVLRSFADVRFILWMSLANLAVVAAAIVPAVSLFGLLGAVGASIAGILVAKVMALVRMRRFLRTGLRGLLPWKDLGWTAAASLAAAVPALWLEPRFEQESFLLLAVQGTVYAVVLVVLYCAVFQIRGTWPVELRRFLRLRPTSPDEVPKPCVASQES